MASQQPAGAFTIMGSGEMAESMRKVHQRLLSRTAGRLRPVFVDTPAGFQLNADELSERAAQYFQKHFNVPLAVASFKNSSLVGSPATEASLAILKRANYVFAGPGSPSYAARHWQNSPFAAAFAERLAAGAQIVFASAAAIAASRYALPVYEIYKVGEAPRWIDGIDLLGAYGLELAIITHWNNAEGGTHDTRYAYLGEPRLRLLEEAVPDSAVILGVDEHTACIIDLHTHKCEVMGAGRVTIRKKGLEVAFKSGTSFAIDYLAKGSQVDMSLPAELEGTLLPPHQTEAEQPIMEEPECQTAPPVAGLVDLLIEVRAELRRNHQWPLADAIRQRLGAHGIMVEDGPEGTSWLRPGT